MTTAPPAPFGRILTAMATAFHDDGSLDVDGTARIAAHLMDNGHDGVVVSGTTGESPTTSVEESGAILRAVKDAVGARGTVVAGVGSASTAHSLELTRRATEIGADGVLLVTPYYNKPGQAGILHHFLEVGRSTDLPVMLYDVPGRTGSVIAVETYAAARDQLPNVVAVKDAVGDFARGVRLRDLGYSVYSGDDHAHLGWLAHGACGFVSVVGHAAGQMLSALAGAFFQGDTESALALYRRLLPVMDAMMGVPNYGATTAKGALQLLGVLDNRNVRGPLVPLSETELADLESALKTAGLV